MSISPDAISFLSDTKHLESLMAQAVDLAWEGVQKGESPFAALVINRDGSVIESAHNQVRSRNDPSAHAEVLAIRQASHRFASVELSTVGLISTGEPCPMCAATAAIAKIPIIAFGASADWIQRCGYETLGTRCQELFRKFHREALIKGNILQDRCERLLRENQNSEA